MQRSVKVGRRLGGGTQMEAQQLSLETYDGEVVIAS